MSAQVESSSSPSTHRVVRPKQPSLLACLTCRRKHLKCDAQMPICGRCTKQGLECVYEKSRRGYRPIRVARGPLGPSVDAPDGRSKASVDDNGAATQEDAVLSWLSNTKETASTQGKASSSSDASSMTQDIPLTNKYDDSGAKDGLITIYYERFHPAHPFLIPRKLYYQNPAILPEYLKGAMRLMASQYSPGLKTDSYESVVETVLSDDSSDSGFKVQAMMLIAMYSFASLEQETGAQVLEKAISMALRLGLNTLRFQDEPILEESWRRTWWDCFFVVALASSLDESQPLPLKQMRLMVSSSADLPVPGHDDEYNEGRVSNVSRTLEDMQDRAFDNEEFRWSSSAYRVEAARILYSALEVGRAPPISFNDSRLEGVEAAIANFQLSLPVDKQTIVPRNGRIDEVLFSAQMVIHLSSIIIHRPRSSYTLVQNHYLTACTKFPTPAIAGYDIVSHTSKALQAANALSKLISIQSPLANHTPCFSCSIASSATVQMPAFMLEDDTGEAQALKERLRLSLGALKSISEVWPLAGLVNRQLAEFARSMFARPARAPEPEVARLMLPATTPAEMQTIFTDLFQDSLQGFDTNAFWPATTMEQELSIPTSYQLSEAFPNANMQFR